MEATDEGACDAAEVNLQNVVSDLACSRRALLLAARGTTPGGCGGHLGVDPCRGDGLFLRPC